MVFPLDINSPANTNSSWNYYPKRISIPFQFITSEWKWYFQRRSQWSTQHLNINMKPRDHFSSLYGRLHYNYPRQNLVNKTKDSKCSRNQIYYYIYAAILFFQAAIGPWFGLYWQPTPSVTMVPFWRPSWNCSRSNLVKPHFLEVKIF